MSSAPRQRRLLTLLAAVFAVLAFLLAALTDAREVGALVFAPAVVLFAAVRGTVGGALAGVAATGLLVIAAAISAMDLSPLAVLARGLPLLVIGAGIGRLAAWLQEKTDQVVAMKQEVEEVATTFRAVFESALDAVLILDDDRRILDANGAVAAVVGDSRDALIGRRIGERAPAERQAHIQGLWRTFREQGTMRGEHEFVSQDGVRRLVEFTATADFLPGRHLAVVRDCTERKRSEEAVRQRAGEQADIADLGLLALGGLDPDDLMEAVVGRLASRLGVEYVGILERLADGGWLLFRAGVGWCDGVVGEQHLSAGDSHAGRSLANGNPVLLGDLPSDTRLGDAELLEAHGVLSGVCVPIRGPEAPWGALCAYSRSDGPFSRDDVTFLRAAANTLAMAIARRNDDQELRRRSEEIARLAAERQRIVAEALNAEDRARERISQHLHDELLQSLFVIRHDLAQLAAGADRPDLVVRARDAVHQAIRDLRGTVFDLHPVVLERGGLGSAVGAIAHDHAARGGFEISVDISPDAEGPLDRLVLSLVRELVANVSRHAEARHAQVKLRRNNGALSLEVMDDGRGIDPGEVRQAVTRGHIGLASAAQRVEALGGRFELLSPPWGGTVIRAEIPIGDAWTSPIGGPRIP